MDRAANPSRPRDERLDFFRGLTMFVIFVAHADINPLNSWIPARFGFSSGTEIFVFCSGFASALAFGSIFVKRGFLMGLARIAYRIWQIYWAHLCSAFAVIGVMTAAHRLFADRQLHLDPLPQIVGDPLNALLSLLTLHWLPSYLDILPMYLVLLALIPLMMALKRFHAALPIGMSVLLYALVWTSGINLYGNSWTGEGWFFNPFAWQLVFFSGFAFSMGWLPAPALRDRKLMTASLVFLAASIPLAFWGIREMIPGLDALYHAILPDNEKTDLHPLRFLHFLALAYVALSLVEGHRHRLLSGGAAVIVRVGQQSLAVFLASLVTARVASVVFQLMGADILTATLVNLAGGLVVIATANTARWFKSTPWQKARIERQAESASSSLPATKANPA